MKNANTIRREDNARAVWKDTIRLDQDEGRQGESCVVGYHQVNFVYREEGRHMSELCGRILSGKLPSTKMT